MYRGASTTPTATPSATPLARPSTKSFTTSFVTLPATPTVSTSPELHTSPSTTPSVKPSATPSVRPSVTPSAKTCATPSARSSATSCAGPSTKLIATISAIQTGRFPSTSTARPSATTTATPSATPAVRQLAPRNMKMKARWQQAVRKLQLTDWDTPMLRPERFEIKFDAPGAVYFSQQTITGKVILQVDDPLNLKGVKMRFRGECCIHFTEYPRKLQNLRKNKKERRRKQEECAGSDSCSQAKWSARQNGHSGGIENPGYIPDGTEMGDGVQTDLREDGSGSACHASARRLSQRPNSTECAWLESSLSGPKQHYRAQETYFDCEFYIYGHKYQKDEKEMLPAGLHEFPFAFSLPPNLPPSFNSEKGFIGYMAVAILDRPAAANIVQKEGFSLHSILDLNMDSHANSTTSSSKAKNLCCFCCQTGPITLSARIPRRGFVPGEKIFVSAEADNVSARNTRRTRLLLLQVVTYIMPNGVKDMVEERVLKEIVRGIIPPGESDMWENVAIVVPPLVPANVHLTCRLLRVQYRLDMILEPPLPSSDLRVSLPLIIGSVPLRNRFSSFLPPGETRKPTGLPGIKYKNYPSYWFGECMFGKEFLESQYERVTGMHEDYGPQYTALTPFAPNYICYTTGNNVDEEDR